MDKKLYNKISTQNLNAFYNAMGCTEKEGTGLSVKKKRIEISQAIVPQLHINHSDAAAILAFRNPNPLLLRATLVTITITHNAPTKRGAISRWRPFWLVWRTGDGDRKEPEVITSRVRCSFGVSKSMLVS